LKEGFRKEMYPHTGTELQSNCTASLTVDLSVLTNFDDAQLDGEPDLIVELIDLYLEEASKLLAVMREAVAKKDELPIKQAAHSLRGSSGNLGILQMTLMCREVEQMKSDDIFPIGVLVNKMEQELVQVRQILLEERQRRSL
jgi:HPt (histidine-containing phosphotransfer) domain-containing protein